jgi:5'-3' exonuclease
MVQLHLVDGTYELFRAYFAVPSESDDNGVEVGATRGLVRSLKGLCRQADVTHVAVAFDTVVESFRNQMFDGYKTGEDVPADLMAQFPSAEQAVRDIGLVAWSMVEFEADDALCTGAARWRDDVDRVVLCTPDKDLAQCVIGKRVVMFDRRRETIRDEAGVIEKFGVRPASIPDYLALVGDAADGIPGVRRWGAKSSGLVLSTFGRVEDIPDDPAQWGVKVRGAAALAAELAAHREEVALYKRLATLREDVPLAEALEDLRVPCELLEPT